jgi:hypothetical protein
MKLEETTRENEGIELNVCSINENNDCVVFYLWVVI